MIGIYQHVGAGLLMLLGLGCLVAAVRGFDHLKTIFSEVAAFPFRILEVHAYLPRHSQGHPHWTKDFRL